MRKWKVVALISALALTMIGGASAAWADDPSPSPSPSATSSQGGSISGVVTTDTGAPAEGVQVVADAVNSPWWWTYAGSASVAADGTYTLTGLADGDYRIQFQNGSSSAGIIQEFWRGAADFASGTTITISNGAAVAGISPVLTVGATISGRVTDSTGAGIAGAYITATDAMNQMLSGNAVADADGTYRITGVRAGTYDVHFESGYMAPGLAPQWWKNASTRSAATPITVFAGQETAAVDATLLPAGSISGVVKADTGAPAPGVMVAVYAATPGGYDWVNTSTTDADGAYSVGGLAASDYRVQFSTAGSLLSEWYDNADDYATATPVTVSAGASTEANAVLTTGATVTGVVTDGKGRAVEGATVAAVPASGDGYEVGTVTAADGTYTITGLRPGDYKIQFRNDYAVQNVVSAWWKGSTQAKARVLTLAAGSVTAGVSAKLDAGAAISGIVRGSDGEQFWGGQVTAYDDSDKAAGFAWVDQDGVYSVRGLSAGAYRLKFQGQSADGSTLIEWWKNASTPSAATPIAVKGGQELGAIDADISSANGAVSESFSSSLSGVVTDGLGQPIAGARVTVDFMNGGDVTTTDADGRWSFAWLPAGTYRVSFTAAVGGSQVTQWWNGASSRDTATPIALSEAEHRTGIDVALGAGALPAVRSAAPKITGPVRVGSVVTAHVGGWAAHTSFSYQWYADGAPIAGATAVSLPITPNLVDEHLTVLVTGELAGYQSVPRSSAPTAPVAVR